MKHIGIIQQTTRQQDTGHPNLEAWSTMTGIHTPQNTKKLCACV